MTMNEQLKLGNLRLSVENNDNNLLKSLLQENTVNVNYAFKNVMTAKNDVRHNHTALFIAARNKNLQNVNILLDHGADVNIKDSMNETSLFSAVELGCLDVVKRLVEAGADINVQNRKGLTVVHYSLIRARPDIFKYLLSLRPKLDMIDQFGQHIGFVALLCKLMGLKYSGSKSEALFSVMDTLKRTPFLEWLLQAGLDPNLNNDRFRGPVLVMAVRDIGVPLGRFSDALKLIQYGADVNACEPNKKTGRFTALCYAYSFFQFSPFYFSPTFIQFLVDAGANLWQEQWRNEDGNFYTRPQMMIRYKSTFDYLNFSLRNPLSLLNQCRINVRRNLKGPGRNLHEKIDTLVGNLPPTLVHFLKMKEMDRQLNDVKLASDKSVRKDISLFNPAG